MAEESDDQDKALAEALMRTASDMRSEAAVDERSARTVFRHMAESQSRLTGLLRDAAESGALVVVETVVGRRHRGAITSVGKDYAVLEGVIVALAALVSVQMPGTNIAPSARESDDSARSLIALMGDMMETRSMVRIWIEGHQVPKSGEVKSVGEDLVQLVADGQSFFIPVDAIAEVVKG